MAADDESRCKTCGKPLSTERYTPFCSLKCLVLAFRELEGLGLTLTTTLATLILAHEIHRGTRKPTREMRLALAAMHRNA